MKRVVTFCVIFLALALLDVASVSAQEQGATRPAARGKKINIDELQIVGKIAKPQVQFIISREKGSMDDALTLKASFVPKIIESVQEAPF